MEYFDIPLKIKKLYPHLNESFIEDMVECARDILLNTLYPFDDTIDKIPPRKNTWIYRCVLEQVERKGITSYLGFSENGIKATFDRSQVSQSLIDELTPEAGII